LPTPKESQFAKKVWAELDKIPCSYFFTTQQKSIRGTPDVIGCVNGKFVALELKRSGSAARLKTGHIVLQRHTLGKISKAGGIGCFVYPENLEEVISLIWSLAPDKGLSKLNNINFP